MDNRYGKDNSKRKKYDSEDTYGTLGNYETLPTELSPALREPEEAPERNPEEENGKKKKPTKQERKEERKRQAEYEKELVAEGKIAPRYRYAPRGGFAGIVSVCVAFILGFFAAFGAIAGVLAVFGTKKVKDVSEIASLDYESIFTDYAANLTALDLVVEIAQKISGGEFTTLQSVADYTPFVDGLADGVITQLADAGITAEKQELMAVPFSEIGAWFQEKISGISDDLTLGEVIKIDEKSPVILQSLKNTLISNLSSEVKELTLGKILGEEQMKGNKILRNLTGSTLASLPQDIQNLTVEQVFGDEMYSYLSINDNDGKTYEQIIREYDHEDKDSPRPVSISLQDGDEIETVTDEDGTKHFYLASDTERENELDRYLDGTWYLLFGEEEENEGNAANKSILAMSTNVADVIKKVNEMPLWELWLHGIIAVNSNPYQKIKYKDYNNLNEFTVPNLINYVMEITQIL